MQKVPSELLEILHDYRNIKKSMERLETLRLVAMSPAAVNYSDQGGRSQGSGTSIQISRMEKYLDKKAEFAEWAFPLYVKRDKVLNKIHELTSWISIVILHDHYFYDIPLTRIAKKYGYYYSHLARLKTKALEEYAQLYPEESETADTAEKIASKPE